jgi:hypothetical protein
VHVEKNRAQHFRLERVRTAKAIDVSSGDGLQAWAEMLSDINAAEY